MSISELGLDLDCFCSYKTKPLRVLCSSLSESINELGFDLDSFFYKTKSLRLLLRFAYTVESFGNQSGVRWEKAATSMVPLLPTLPRYLPHPFCSSSASSQSHYHHRDTPKKTPQKPTKTHLLLQQINSKRLTKAHNLSHKSSSQTRPTTPNLIPQKIHKRVLFQYPCSHKRTQQKGIVLSSPACLLPRLA